MNCLSCHKELNSSSDRIYHRQCIRRLFDAYWMPTIKFKYGDISIEARKLVGKMSLSGMQAKLSVKIEKQTRSLEVVAVGGSHILKPSPEQWPHLAENENLCMNLAAEFGIEVPGHGLLPLADGTLAYIVKRFDRIGIGKVHVEDFAQLLEAEDKYHGSIERIGNFLKKHSEIPYIDTQKFFTRILFNFIIGNGDAHLKNFAMIRLSGGYRLSPAFDVVNSRLAIPNEADESAISINGKKNNLSIKDFERTASNLEVNPKIYNQLIKRISALNMNIEKRVKSSFLPADMKERFLSIFQERLKRLEKTP